MKMLKEATWGMIEKKCLKTGSVLAVREWTPSSFLELDLHLPGVDMGRWDYAAHIKCRVAPLTYRDYTVAGWDAETHTCTLYIDAAHEGPGSKWARSVAVGDGCSYIHVSRTIGSPLAFAQMVCLGDGSGLGHFLALKQVMPWSTKLSGALLLPEQRHRDTFDEYFQMPIEPLAYSDNGAGCLEKWLAGRDLYEDPEAEFYLAGNVQLVNQLRKILRSNGVDRPRIHAQGFWG
jgi:NADPH-dependent ferric siderophore reductase